MSKVDNQFATLEAIHDREVVDTATRGFIFIHDCSILAHTQTHTHTQTHWKLFEGEGTTGLYIPVHV